MLVPYKKIQHRVCQYKLYAEILFLRDDYVDEVASGRVFRGISLITPLPMVGVGEGLFGPFLIPNHTLSYCSSIATL